MKLIESAEWQGGLRDELYAAESSLARKRKVEGKTGSPPAPFGIGSRPVLDAMADAIQDLKAVWASLSVTERLQGIRKAANRALSKSGVPGLLKVAHVSQEARGRASTHEWCLIIGDELATAARLDDVTAAALCNITVHEIRHIEQAYLAARYSAFINPSYDARTLAQEQDIPEDIARYASANPLVEGVDPEFEPARAWYFRNLSREKLDDADTVERLRSALKALATCREAALRAVERLEKGATQGTIEAADAERKALLCAVENVKFAYGDYRGMLLEADSHEIGDAAESVFRGRAPHSRPSP